jgi:hypothetical protein
MAKYIDGSCSADLDAYTIPDGVTHLDAHTLSCYSNNFKGWIQYRSLIKNNVCDKFDYSKEVDEDGLVITEETEI